MNLSNRLAFSLIFSVVLAVLFALTVAPAMAQVLVTAYQTTTTASSTDPVATGSIVIKFTYSETPNPRPDFSHFTADDNTISQPDDEDTDRDVLAASYNDGTNDITAAVGGEGKTVTLTLTGSTAVTPTLPAGLLLSGYSTGLSTVQESTTALIADGTNTPTLLVLATDHMAGYSYRVYARSTTAGETPILPTTVSTTAENFFALPDMPDLEDFFNVRGGTIDLVVPGAADLDVIINEIMWGIDNSRVGQNGYTQQQWIEVYNRKTTPVPIPTFTFTDDTFPAPVKADGVVDRISNIAGYQNVWNPPIKGSSGTAVRNEAGDAIIGANPAFVSVYRSKQDGNGTQQGHWTASNRAYFPGFIGTPGSENTRAGLPGTRGNPTAAVVPKDNIIINEVGNYADNTLDWIELHNISSGTVNIKNWTLTRTDGTNRAEHLIVQFADKNTNIGAGDVLLIVNKDPVNTSLAAGIDIRESDRANQQFGAGPHKYLNIKRSDGRDLHIPNMTAGYLILRSNGDAKFRGGRLHIRDVVGPSRVSYNTLEAATDIKEPDVGQFWKTDAWPLNGHSGNNYRVHNAKDSNNHNASLAPNANFKNDSVWARNGIANGWRKGGGSHAGFNGGIGYDRGVKGNGTPGYHNDIVKGKTGDLTDGGLIISELMLTTDNGKSPQWIELHNTSRTRGINLASDGSNPKTGWQMIIENHNSGSWQADNRPLHITIDLKTFGDIQYIPPNQTVLIASRRVSGNKKSDYIDDHRVASVWGIKAIRDKFGMKNSKSPILNAENGFYIKIVDGDGNPSDEVGNLDGVAFDTRKGIGIDDAYSWHWPTDMTDDNNRTSLIRLMDGGTRGVQGVSSGTAGTPRPGIPKRSIDGDMTGMVLPMGTQWRGNGMVVMGTDADGNPIMVPAKYAGAAWVHAADNSLADVVDDTYYGDNNDVSTPLHTAGTPLPVSLSFFRPTLTDGKVVIHWTTESELDNAGFNILRSDSRNGEFTQVNDQLIQGKGTTAERSTYKWVDISAKPGAVYYYQIEDVSFAGERNTLTTTKLKGLISTKNKLTTTWSELKSQN